MGGDVNQLLPGIAPIHASELDFNIRLFLEDRKQVKQKFVIFVCIRDGCEFDGYHVYLTEIFLRIEIVSFIVARISGVRSTAPASNPSIAAPMTGGTRNRTRRAFAASLWMVSRIGSMNIGPPSNMLPVMTTSKARFSNSSWRITAFANSPISVPAH